MPKISEKLITDTAAPKAGRTLIFDDHKDAPKGFGLRVTPTGKRSFVLRYSSDGKDRLMSVGDHPTWTLAAARKQAGELRREIDGGTDILEQRRDRRAELTVADVVKRFCESHGDKLTSGPAIRGALNRHLLPALGKKKITDVRRRDVIHIVESLAQEKGRQAALLLTYTKQMFAWCEDREIIEANPVATLKAKKVARELSPTSRARVLSDDEIRTLWNRDAPPDGMHESTWLALLFVLATGQRPGEVCKASKIEIKDALWTIPAEHRGKTSDAHMVPLTDTALALIKRADGGDYLFERRKGHPIDVNALSKALRRCGDSMGNLNGAEGRWRPQDLRRTMRTRLAAAKVSETVAEATIGHVRKGIVGVYDRHRYDAEKLAAMQTWERELLRILGRQASSAEKIVAISSARP